MVKTEGIRRRRRRGGNGPKARVEDPWTRFRVGAGLLALVVAVGTVGYAILGLAPLDALYQTVITISTVGYREIGEVDGRYQVFSIVLILFGTGLSLYTLGVLLETLFEGSLDDQLWRWRMQRDVDRLDHHVIVCGCGQVGRAITDEVLKAGHRVVVVDREVVSFDEEEGGGFVPLLVTGEATDDAVLEAAGISRASTLVMALDNDADNLYVTLSARTLRPDLFIVARANQAHAAPKLLRAGADRVVNPHEIGGTRMAALVLQPEVAEFLDVVMHDRELEVRLAEVALTPSSPFHSRSLAACGIREQTGATVLAVRRDGDFHTNPPPDLVLAVDDVVIALGTPDQLADLRRLAGP